MKYQMTIRKYNDEKFCITEELAEMSNCRRITVH